MDEVLSLRSRYVISAIHEDDAIVKSMEKSGKTVVKLNLGDPAVYFQTPQYIVNAFTKALQQGMTHYSDPVGLSRLRHAVSERQRRLYRLDSDIDDIIITQGVSEAIMLTNSILVNPRDSGVLFRPYYPQYLPSLEFCMGKGILGDYDEESGWSADIEGLRKRLRAGKRMKYLIVNNPNNPTGSVMERSLLREIAELAKDYGLVLISDEIYDEIVYNGAHFTSISEVAKGIPYIILNGASKVFSATGFRIGFAIVPGSDSVSLSIKSRLRAMSTLRLSASTPAEYAVAEGILNEHEHEISVSRMTTEIARRINNASRLINESEYMHTVLPRGAFYLFPKLDMKRLKFENDREFEQKLLKEEAVHITRGSGFGIADHIRIVALAPEYVMASAIDRINRFCRKHSKR